MSSLLKRRKFNAWINVLELILKILLLVISALAVFYIVVSIIEVINPDWILNKQEKWNDMIRIQVPLGGKMTVFQDEIVYNWRRIVSQLVMSFTSKLYRMICESIIIYLLIKILHSIKVGTPFIIKNAKYITIIGFTLAAYICGHFLMSLIYYILFNYNFTLGDLSKILVTHVISSTSWEMVGIAVLLLIIAKVFRHGCFLQTEHDQTL